jgi:hypothetical protein
MNNNLQQKNSTPCAASTKTVCLALHQQTSTPCAASTNQHVSRRDPENVPTNSQNGPKSKQISDPLHKHKQNYTQHNPSTNNNLRACPVLFRKNCTPGGTSTGQRVSRRDPENEPTNSQNGPKSKQRTDLTLKNRFAALQEPTMSGQNASGTGKRKGPQLETDAFKKKSLVASTSRQALEGFWVKFTKVDIVSLDAARTTTTTKERTQSKSNF